MQTMLVWAGGLHTQRLAKNSQCIHNAELLRLCLCTLCQRKVVPIIPLTMVAAALLFSCHSCMCRGVVAFRRWLHEKAGGDVGWAGGASSSDLGPS